MKKLRVIIWGWPLFSHSHAFIHEGFYRAFKYLGYETNWLDDQPVNGDDFKNCIFLCEGQQVEHIPNRKDCFYICHNVVDKDIKGKYVNIQYLTKEWKDLPEVAPGIKIINDCLLFAWGSNLLPNEFNEELLTTPRTKNIWHIGALDSPSVVGGNYYPIARFAKAAYRSGYTFNYAGLYSAKIFNPYLHYKNRKIDEKAQKRFLSTCAMAPALQGDRQLENGMIPCRLFKSIQYGGDGISNNSFANEYFGGELIYDEDPANLFYLKVKKDANNLDRRKYLFNFVRKYHTYVNRVEAILKILL